MPGPPKKWPTPALKQEAYRRKQEAKRKNLPIPTDSELLQQFINERRVGDSKEIKEETKIEIKEEEAKIEKKEKKRKAKLPPPPPPDPTIPTHESPLIQDARVIDEKFYHDYLLSVVKFNDPSPQIAQQLANYLEKKGGINQTQSKELDLTDEQVTKIINADLDDLDVDIQEGEEIKEE